MRGNVCVGAERTCVALASDVHGQPLVLREDTQERLHEIEEISGDRVLVADLPRTLRGLGKARAQRLLEENHVRGLGPRERVALEVVLRRRRGGSVFLRPPAGHDGGPIGVRGDDGLRALAGLFVAGGRRLRRRGRFRCGDGRGLHHRFPPGLLVRRARRRGRRRHTLARGRAGVARRDRPVGVRRHDRLGPCTWQLVGRRVRLHFLRRRRRGTVGRAMFVVVQLSVRSHGARGRRRGFREPSTFLDRVRAVFKPHPHHRRAPRPPVEPNHQSLRLRDRVPLLRQPKEVRPLLVGGLRC